MVSPEATAVVNDLINGDLRALARAITLVENHADGFRQMLAKLYPRTGKSIKIGITGPPGSGKSTMVNCLARHFLNQDKRLAIVAVDPTSPFTGGALLGDRVRMNDLPRDGRVFIRSMATRGASGGLAVATENVAIVLDAFGFDITLIETVGVGQIELDIVDACDTVVVVLVPESGDAVQTMKAGLMEIADIMVVNKADRPGSDKIAAELKQSMELRAKSHEDWQIPVIATQAANDINIDQVVTAIDEHIAFWRKTGKFERHRSEQAGKKIIRILRNRFSREILEKIAADKQFKRQVQSVLARETDPYSVADGLFEKYCNS